jgi:hypothetical protein
MVVMNNKDFPMLLIIQIVLAIAASLLILLHFIERGTDINLVIAIFSMLILSIILTKTIFKRIGVQVIRK